MSNNITWHDMVIRRKDRESNMHQKGKVIWLTGLSGSGKSTIASLLEKRLYDNEVFTYLLDGDNIESESSEDEDSDAPSIDLHKALQFLNMAREAI